MCKMIASRPLGSAAFTRYRASFPEAQYRISVNKLRVQVYRYGTRLGNGLLL